MKTIKTVTTIITLLIVFASVYTIIMPSSSAKFSDIFSCYSKVIIDFDNEVANHPFLPVDMVKEIPMTINDSVEGYFDNEVPLSYANLDNFIYLDIVEKPDWCTVTLSPNFLKMKATADGLTEEVKLIIKVDENAHALSIGKIGIKVDVDRTGALQGGTFYSNISFIPGFYPLLNLNIPEGTVKKIGPLGTAKFNIEIENMGNAKTTVICNAINLPEGWIASIDQETLIETGIGGNDPKKTVSLVIQPPYGFGYHDDREIIQVEITPTYFENQSITGEKYLVYFTIQSKGFSTPGFEAAFALFVLIGVSLVVKKQQKQKGTSSKKNNGGTKQ